MENNKVHHLFKNSKYIFGLILIFLAVITLFNVAPVYAEPSNRSQVGLLSVTELPVTNEMSLTPEVSIPIPLTPSPEQLPPPENPLSAGASLPTSEPQMVSQRNDLIWSVEMEVTVEAQQLSALGGVESVKNQLKNDLSGLMSDKSIVTDVITKQDGSGKTAYELSLKGQGALAQLKTALYSDLKDKSPLLGGVVALSIEGNVQAGETLPYILDSNLSTGYIWEVQDAQGNLYPLENQQSILNTSNGIGASQKQTLKIGASASGQGKLTLVYHRPWEKDAPATRKISIQASKLSDVLDLSNPVQVQTTRAIIPDGATSGSAALSGSLVGLPTAFDWRSQGVTIPIRDQGNCGSCWAFSTVGAMEGALVRAGVANPDLSEQYLVSCNNNGWSCNGGWDAHDYHVNRYMSPQTVAGAVLESDFPYTATNGSCSRAYNHPYRLNSWSYVGSSTGVPSTEAIKNAIYTYGPISVGVCVGNSFQSYRSGVFATNDTASCGGSTNHAVVLTGWDDSTQSWVMRNSWGSSWGESGYMRIRYGYSNIGDGASYVVYGGVTPTRTPTSVPTSTQRPTSTPTSTIRPTSTPTSTTRPVSTLTSTTRPTSTPTSTTRPASTPTSTARPTSTTRPTSLTAPTLVSPINSATVSSNLPIFTWSAVSGSTQYYLYVTNVSNIAYVYQWFTAASANCASGSGQCSVTSPRSLPGGSLTWKVRAGNPDETGTYSTVGTFNVPTPPAAATLVSPLNLLAVNSTNPIYTWNAVSNATSYYLIVRGLRGTITSQWFSKEQASCTSGIGTCSVIPTQTLNKNSIYTWQVQTANTNGSGPLSRIGTFRISGTAKPKAPKALSLSVQRNLTTSLNFTWKAVQNANQYEIMIMQKTATKARQTVTPIQTNCAIGSGNCTFALPSSLATGTYRWSVRASNPVGYSPWSNTITFQVNP